MRVDYGQTIMHYHVHLIPRREGDMDDPPAVPADGHSLSSLCRRQEAWLGKALHAPQQAFLRVVPEACLSCPCAGQVAQVAGGASPNR